MRSTTRKEKKFYGHLWRLKLKGINPKMRSALFVSTPIQNANYIANISSIHGVLVSGSKRVSVVPVAGDGTSGASKYTAVSANGVTVSLPALFWLR